MMAEILGENLVFAYNATDYLDECFKPAVDRKIPFSTTQGNVGQESEMKCIC